MFWQVVGLLIIGFLGLCYLRRQIQGYWYDRRFYADPKIDLSGKTALITGGNSGVGLEKAVELARLGADVVIACRSLEKAQVAIHYIKKKSKPQSEVSAIHLDLADLDSVYACAQSFTEQKRSLHFLFNNAGIASPTTHTLTKNGFELTFQSNYLGHFLLTNLLLPTMKESAKTFPGCRIIATSSGAHSNADIAWEDINYSSNYNSYVYGQSKLAQILHSKELQKQFDQEQLPILSVAYTPGLARTNIFSIVLARKWWRKLLGFLLLPLFLFLSRSAKRGAQTALYCAFDKDIVGGGYYSNCLEKPAVGKNDIANDPQAAKKLWELSEEMLKDSCLENR